MTIGQKIKLYRTVQGLKQTVLADRLTIPVDLVNSIEKDRLPIPDEVLSQLEVLSGYSASIWKNPHLDLPITSADPQLYIKNRLRNVMEDWQNRTGDNQADFANLIDIEPTIWSRILNTGSSGRKVSEETIWKVASKTGVRREWLWTGLGEMYGSDLSVRPSTRNEGEQLFWYLEANNISLTELSSRMNVAKSTISGYRRTTRFSSKNSQRILDALGKSYNEVFGISSEPIITLSGEPAVGVNEPGNPYIRIRPLPMDVRAYPVLKIPMRARAGFGYAAFIEGPESDKEYELVLGVKLLKGTKITEVDGKITLDPEHVIIPIDGDSMEPTMEAGYEMLAYKLPGGTLPKLNSLVVVDYHDELVVKRLSAIDYVDGTITLRSDNGGSEMRILMDDVRGIFRIIDYYQARL